MPKPKGRYELRSFCKNTRGNYRRVKSGTIHGSDPHYMALELWRLEQSDKASHCYGWRYEVDDLQEKRGNLVPVISYEELLRRAKSVTVAKQA